MVDGVDHYLVGEAIMAKMLAGGLVQRETGLVRGHVVCGSTDEQRHGSPRIAW